MSARPLETTLFPTKYAITVLTGAVITANGSSPNFPTGPYLDFLTYIYVGGVSGTSPSLTVSFNAYDPVSNSSVTLNSLTITGAGAYYMSVNNYVGQYFNIAWTVGGTSPSFTGVYLTVYMGAGCTK